MLANNSVLLQSELFAGLDQTVVEKFTATAELRSFAPDEMIIAEGQQASFVYCVMNGFVRLSKSESAGREADICVCESGDTFGEYLLAGGGSYAYSARSAGGAEVALFALADLQAFADQHPVVHRNVMRIMVRHLLGAMECIARDRLLTAAQRVANYLMSRCPASASQVTFRLPYRKRILAGKLGLAPEALSRAFATLAASGVEVRGNVVLVDSVSQLRKAC
ncbi:cyclic nucleotide-binding domain-containing protein [Rhizobium leguminosarum]|uniref:Crp/Fnr family transcriptional regulator n=1 Tax=Rhizobium leguminosarum TaxID=384 RepID=UPI001C9839C8|nr:cyclic nucleotide-binding domain-containing protein [Rhizobium leguminosarum]MBY5611965.1 cyclic nucleotide-binding domain-containing protein [Rhizobium leguminosarum]MBY5619667.1 cyclic nucleotide-binding domain-containing protein [Rhizobium leguminosarum]MBY5654809.1 cyclic nucleotide-binding domain-containing protein [Rhizobium leguminosarum]MBY5672996.1 cyclic nucleotide-binding domain-containing protein [Rhizobium leguminosarum]MBY5686576.1 cyclic nucleotide-binding domain-containing p